MIGHPNRLTVETEPQGCAGKIGMFLLVLLALLVRR